MHQLVVISAPSGSGKSTLIDLLLAKNEDFGFTVSHTTRYSRKGEVEGREYYFISLDDFKKKIAVDFFLEWKQVHGNYYGTSKDEVQRLKKTNRKVILDVDVQGALELKKKKLKQTISLLSRHL